MWLLNSSKMTQLGQNATWFDLMIQITNDVMQDHLHLWSCKQKHTWNNFVNELLSTTDIEAAKLQFKSVIVMVWIQKCDGGKWLSVIGRSLTWMKNRCFGPAERKLSFWWKWGGNSGQLERGRKRKWSRVLIESDQGLQFHYIKT